MTIPPPINQPTPEQLSALRAAEVASKKIRRAVSFARGDAWSIAVVAVLTLLTGFNELSSILLGGLMGFIAFREFHSSAELANFDPLAARRLAANQLLFIAGVTMYSLWKIHVTKSSPSSITAGTDLSAADSKILESYGIGEMETEVYTWVYGGLIFATVLTQGTIAFYYESRRKLVELYLRDTPAWVVQFQQRGK